MDYNTPLFVSDISEQSKSGFYRVEKNGVNLSVIKDIEDREIGFICMVTQDAGYLREKYKEGQIICISNGLNFEIRVYSGLNTLEVLRC